MAIDWSKAPDGAEFYAAGSFYKKIKGDLYFYENDWWHTSKYSMRDRKELSDYRERPIDWPATDERIDRIGRDRTTEDMGHYVKPVEKTLSEMISDNLNSPPKTSAEYLSECLKVQTERGKQYDASGTGERSFAAAAAAFNAATGKALTGSDVCLLLAMIKLVRQYSSPDRLHQDSLLDGVSYMSLWAEELTKELS